jgi:hypothetical protein
VRCGRRKSRRPGRSDESTRGVPAGARRATARADADDQQRCEQPTATPDPPHDKEC